MNWRNKETERLLEAILALETAEETRRFLRDLMTEGEIIEFGRRLKAAELLASKVPYSRITKETGLSSTTVARISKWLNDGMGGYQLMIDRLHHHNSPPVGKGSN